MESLEFTATDAIAGMLYDLGGSHETPSSVRRSAITTFGAVAEPDAANYERVMNLLRSRRKSTRTAGYQALSGMLRRAKTSTRAVAVAHEWAMRLESLLVKSWNAEVEYSNERSEVAALRYIRSALVELERLQSLHEEFIERLSLCDAVPEQLSL